MAVQHCCCAGQSRSGTIVQVKSCWVCHGLDLVNLRVSCKHPLHHQAFSGAGESWQELSIVFILLIFFFFVYTRIDTLKVRKTCKGKVGLHYVLKIKRTCWFVGLFYSFVGFFQPGYKSKF